MGNKPQENPKDTADKVPLVRTLLGFLDRNLGHFSPTVQNVIGLGVLFLLAMYILNGFVAPTFVRGKLWLRETANGGKELAEGYKLEFKNEDSTTNRWGNWILPVYRSGMPSKLRIQILNQNGKFVDQFSFVGPIPVWNAIFPMEYDLSLDLFESEGKRIKIVEHQFGDRLLSTVANLLEGLAPAYAASSFAEDVQAPSNNKTDLGKKLADLNVILSKASRVPSNTRTHFAYRFSIQSITLNQFPGWFRSGGKIYFVLTLDNKPLDDKRVLYGGREFSEGWDQIPQFLWLGGEKTLSPVSFKQSFGLPIRSIRESWIFVGSGTTERFKDMGGNLTDCVNFLEANKVEISPKGQIRLHMYSESDTLLGSFDLTKLVSSRPMTANVESSLADQRVNLELSLMPGLIIDVGNFALKKSEISRLD